MSAGSVVRMSPSTTLTLARVCKGSSIGDSCMPAKGHDWVDFLGLAGDLRDSCDVRVFQQYSQVPSPDQNYISVPDFVSRVSCHPLRPRGKGRSEACVCGSVPGNPPGPNENRNPQSRSSSEPSSPGWASSISGAA